MREYKVDAHFRVPYTTTVLAKSDADARRIAEYKAESYQRTTTDRVNETDLNTDYDNWSMRVDDFGLKIESVSRVCRRPFIPNFDD